MGVDQRSSKTKTLTLMMMEDFYFEGVLCVSADVSPSVATFD